MVSVVQLVEHQVVILGVAGSSPVTHPNPLQRERRTADRYRELCSVLRALAKELGLQTVWLAAVTRYSGLTDAEGR
jgi:hypothetical protein